MQHALLVNGRMEKKIAPGILVYNSDIIFNSIDIINKNISPFFQNGMIVNNNTNSYVDLNQRKVKVFNFQKISMCHEDDPINILRKNIENVTYDFLNYYMKKHNISNLEKKHEWEILQYNEGDFFKNHIDDCQAHSRTVSVIIYFNDNYEGGEIEFSSFEVSYKPKSGDVLIFPSSFIYNHNIKKITSGTRYAAVNWFSYTKPTI
jgi:hypothetical protein